MTIKVCDRCKKIINKVENTKIDFCATSGVLPPPANEDFYRISILKYVDGVGSVELKSNEICKQCKDEIIEFYNKGIKELKYDG